MTFSAVCVDRTDCCLLLFCCVRNCLFVVQSSHSKLNEMKPHNMQGYTTEDKQGPSKSKPFSVTSKAQRLRPKSEKGKRERPRMATNGMAWGVSSVDADVGVSVRKSKSEEWQKVAGKSFSDLTLNDLPAKVIFHLYFMVLCILT